MKSHAALTANYPISKHAETVAYGVLLAMLASPLIAAPIVPGDLLVTRSVYQGTASTVTIGQALPGGGIAVQCGRTTRSLGHLAKDRWLTRSTVR